MCIKEVKSGDEESEDKSPFDSTEGGTENFIEEVEVDSVEEFLNVVNGLFTIQLAKEKITAELGLPASGVNVQPAGKNQLRLRAITAFGSFEVVLSVEEFVTGK